MPMVEIDVPEQIAERIAALPRETVSRLLIEQIERITPTGDDLPATLTEWLRQSEELGETLPPRQDDRTPDDVVGDAITAKFRRQGFNL